MSAVVPLRPPLTTDKTLATFNESVAALSVTFSPRANEIAVHTQARYKPPEGYKANFDLFPHQCTVWLASYGGARDSTHLLYRDSYITFRSFQQLTAEQASDGALIDPMQSIEFCHRFVEMYITNLSTHVDRLALEEPFDERMYRHYEGLSVSMHLFQTIFTPQSGVLAGLVGEELLLWLNCNFVAPTGEEGKALASKQKPWLELNFWSYLIRCILRGLSAGALHFFALLASHPSPELRSIIALIPRVLNAQPRSTSFSTENEFFVAHRRWLQEVRQLRVEVDMLDDGDGRGEWREGLEDMMGVLEGKQDVIVRMCSDEEGGHGWREAVGVWGIWVNVELRRDDLTDMLAQVLTSLSIDTTSGDETVQAAFISGDVHRTIRLAAEVDVWLGAHVADVLLKMGHEVYPNQNSTGVSENQEVDPTEENDLLSRDALIMEFAERLHSDPTCWAIELEYLATCGAQGRGRMGEVLRRLAVDVEGNLDSPLDGPDAILNGLTPKRGANVLHDEMEEDVEDAPAEKLGKLTGLQRVEKLVDICREYEMWDELESLCRVVSRILVNKRRYGDAISYCVWGRDVKGIGRIADMLLEEYIDKGPSEFMSLVDELPTATTVAMQLHHLDSPLAGATSSSKFITRLEFLTEYAVFHKLFSEGNKREAAAHLIAMLNSDIVPRWWWGVLLLDAGGMLEDEELLFSNQDTYDLLGYLEEIYIREEQGCGSDYLGALEKMLLKNVGSTDYSATAKPADVIRQLEVVRLALARYLARSFTTLGGRTLY